MPAPSTDQLDTDAAAARDGRALWAADAAAQHLGIDLVDVGPGRATVTLTITETMLNGLAMANGGYVFLLADTAFAIACNTRGHVTVARSCEIVFMRPAGPGDVLVATATERSRAGRSGIYDVTVRNGDDEVVAEMRGQSAAVRPREPE